MNNNEAKKTILEADSCFCKHGAYKDCHSGCKYREALDAAVKALEQEPTTKNDLGVETTQMIDKSNFSQEQYKSDLQSAYDCGYAQAKNDLGLGYVSRQAVLELIADYDLSMGQVVRGIHALPSVTPQEPKWISVSEKLPEPFTFVNATCRSLVDDRENWVVETMYLPIPKEANKHGYSDWGNIPMLNWGEAEVIAWVERIIPQPYKSEVEPQESEDKE